MKYAEHLMMLHTQTGHSTKFSEYTPGIIKNSVLLNTEFNCGRHSEIQDGI